jgi:hypothetical protein
MQRLFPIFLATLAPCLLAACAAPAGPGSSATAVRGLLVILPVPDHGRWVITDEQSHLDVFLKNVSNKPIDVYDWSNSWGYYNLTLKWQTASEKGTITRASAGFTRNVPSVVTIPPGSAIIRQVSLDEWWTDWPNNMDGEKLTARAVYFCKDDPQTPGSPSAWQGMALSAPITIHVLDLRPREMKTP